MATWAKGFDFKNSGNTTRIGGIGTYGTDTAVEKIYIGLGSEPWNNAGLQITSSAINFKGNKIYHAGDKPTPADIGAATSSHTHNYAGSSSAGGNANAAVKLATARKLTIGSTGKTFDGSGDIAWSLSEIGAAASSHTHSYLPLSGGTITGSSFGPLIVKRSGSTNAAAIYFSNDNGNLGAIGMTSSANGGLIRWTNDTASSYVILDTGNYKSTITPANIGAAASSHTHNYAGSASAGGAANSATVLATARKLTIGNTGKTFNGSADVSWSLSEIGAAASSHSHNNVTIKGTNTITTTTNDTTSNWGAQGTSFHWYTTAGCLNNQPSQYGYILNVGSGSEVHQIWMTQSSGNMAHRGGNGSGWNGSWRTILDSSNYSSYAAAASHTHNYAGSSSAGGAANSALACTGNSATATKLATARAINGTNFDGTAAITTANWGTARTITIGSTGKSVNGSGNVSWSLSEIGAAASSHTHNYAGSSSAGGAATSALTCTGNSATATTSNYLASNTRMDYGWNGVNYFNISGTAGAAAKANDTPTTAWWHVMRFNHANSTGYYTDLAVPFNDVSLYYKRVTAGAVQNGGWIRVLDSLNYNTYAPTKTGGGASGTWSISVSGNSATATKLATARTINGTNFDGTAAITTANWGTARTLTIGSTGKSVNGSGNVSWSLSEIGAAAASHTHSYVPLSGGTMTGVLTLNSGANFGSVTLTKASVSDTLQISGTSTTSMGAIKLGSGGCRIYGLGTATKLYVEGGIYTNGTLDGAQGTITPNNIGVYGKDTGGNLFKMIYIDSGNNFVIGEANKKKIRAQADLLPYSESYYLGLTTSGQRWKQVCATTTAIATSDSRKKENITPILRNNEGLKYKTTYQKNINTFSIEEPNVDIATSEDYYNFIKDRFIPYSYNYKYNENREDESTEGMSLEDEIKCCKSIGFVADEYDLENDKVAKEFIFRTEDGLLNYNTGNYATMIAIALKEAVHKIEELKLENNELKSRLSVIEEKLGL